MRFVLVHSPVLGPASWAWVADELEAAGATVEVPDLRPLVDAGPVAFAAAVPGGADAVVAGHSGAGALLPLVPAARRVFVDAGVPPCDGTGSVGGDFLPRLRELAAGRDRLPAWERWFGEGVLGRLVPDGSRRRRVGAELVEVPLAFYEASVDRPAGWCAEPGAYVLLSEAYRDDAERAGALGWPVTELAGAHLDIVTRPDAVAGALLQA